MRKSTLVLSSFIFLFFGMVIGFLLSPVKQGFGNSGNHTGNTINNYYYPQKEDEPGDKEKTDHTK